MKHYIRKILLLLLLSSGIGIYSQQDGTISLFSYTCAFEDDDFDDAWWMESEENGVDDDWWDDMIDGGTFNEVVIDGDDFEYLEGNPEDDYGEELGDGDGEDDGGFGEDYNESEAGSVQSTLLDDLTLSQLVTLLSEWKKMDWSNPNVKYMVDINKDGIIDGYVFKDKNGNIHYQNFDLEEVEIIANNPNNPSIIPIPIPTPIDLFETINESGCPKATKIFRNSKMTDKNLEALEKLLEKILKDCFGKALYNALVEKLKGGTLLIYPNAGNNSFDANGGIISLENIEASPDKLFHEMFHAYQAYNNETVESMKYTAAINIEIEAWYAQYLYIQDSGSNWEELYTDYKMGNAIKNISRFIDANGNLKPGTTTNNFNNYILNQVVPVFDKAYNFLYYNPLSGVPNARKKEFDKTRNILQNFKNINNLPKNCE